MHLGLEIEAEARARLSALLARIPFANIRSSDATMELGPRGHYSPDFVLNVGIGPDQWRLVCEAKSQAQPRQARLAALELKDYLAAQSGANVYPVFVAPYISPASAQICRQAGVGHVDFTGNCHLAFGTVFIELSGEAKPKGQQRGLRSVFGAKSARILRRLLREPNRNWRVADLAKETRTSLGQVSNVRKALVDQEWAAVGTDGVRLVKPGALLDAWRDAYDKRGVSRSGYYSLRKGADLESLIKSAISEAGQGEHALLASYSAARWLAPYARYSTQTLYADEAGESLLRERLQLESASKGENFIIERPADVGIFADRIEAAPGLWSTGLIQTYLDLSVSGERGAEAADHLRMMRIEPSWKNPP